ncbi:hypothetical protein [Paraglaciecola sp. MB-3u-78]|uniref:hypothetical protein n=1 Tax=Paraglaciecola sp. MB-3u-78 TaxID=2058332 RepID=UPI000C3259B8|nr:hypothetical protein [Paraglaciecola sp. MB-3u-78]PKH00416.1 hypothetical protein CXF95_02415 [Paraglaciecola sp. MB-3u-78]
MQSMIAKYYLNESKAEIKVYLVLMPILMLLFGVGLGLIIGAAGDQSPIVLASLLLWIVAIPLTLIGYSVHKVFKKIDVI